MSRRLAVAAAAWLMACGALAAAEPPSAVPDRRLSDVADSIRMGQIIREAESDVPRPSISPIGKSLMNSEFRLIRGVTNILTFPADAFVCPADTAIVFARKPALAPVIYLPFSALQGAGRSVLRLASGVVDVTTCLLPRFQPLAPPFSYHCRPTPPQ